MDNSQGKQVMFQVKFDCDTRTFSVTDSKIEDKQGNTVSGLDHIEEAVKKVLAGALRLHNIAIKEMEEAGY
jgi:hypothetical protein